MSVPHQPLHRPHGLALLTWERPRPDRIRSRPWAWRLAVATVCFGAFMGQLDASIVTLTYGSLRTQFHSQYAAVQWVSLAYMLALVALLIPVGRLSDAHGRKLLYLYGFALFTAASAACGLAPTLGLLIVFRILQAAGAAMLQANSVALVTTSAPPGKMRTALGMQAAGQAIGLALGPTIGGALVATIGWRWVFGINVPVGIIALIAGHYLLPRTRQRSAPRHPDLLSVLLLALTTTSTLLALSVLSGLGPPAWTAPLLLATAAGSGTAFARRQTRCPRPLVDLALLRTDAIAPGLLAGMCGYLVLFGPLVLVPLALARLGVGALLSGIVLTALPLGFALAATLADRLLPRAWSDRTRSRAGLAGCIAALALMALLPFHPAVLPAPLALLGLALGVFLPANNTQVMRAIPAAASGAGGGMVNMTRGLGTALGVATITLSLHTVPGTTGVRTAVATLLAFATLALATTAWRRAADRGTPTGHAS
ncbi:MFS transporter [Streptacidiphilus carbonis]|uniref:MFS transporter n=1 Tax=Streptacidiphilus carbonis TaxID=105422 RepID=UPI000A3FE11F|nr:MFS transporter [Streptacidiphilus carbonis]